MNRVAKTFSTKITQSMPLVCGPDFFQEVYFLINRTNSNNNIRVKGINKNTFKDTQYLIFHWSGTSAYMIDFSVCTSLLKTCRLKGTHTYKKVLEFGNYFTLERYAFKNLSSLTCKSRQTCVHAFDPLEPCGWSPGSAAARTSAWSRCRVEGRGPCHAGC